MSINIKTMKITDTKQMALIEADRCYTHGDLDRSSRLISSVLVQSGIRSGDRIGVCVQNCADFAPVYAAVRGLHCTVVLIDPAVTEQRFQYIVEDAQIDGYIGVATFSHVLNRTKATLKCQLFRGSKPGVLNSPDFSSKIDIWSKETSVGDIIENDRISEDYPAAIIYTSGSTGRPKGVMLSQQNLHHSIEIIRSTFLLTHEDRVLVTMSYTHCAGLLHLLAHLESGAGVVCVENVSLIGSFLRAVQANGVTVLPGVPSFFSFLFSFGSAKIMPYLSSLRIVEFSSSHATSSLLNQACDIFFRATIYNTYGLTEAPRLTYLKVQKNDESLKTVGHPNVKIKIEIEGTSGTGQLGEIYCSGPTVTMGYLGMPELTCKRFTNRGFKTGDLGMIDQSGNLILKGRADDMFKVNGEMVYPAEIEDALARHPLVNEAIVFPTEDPMQGNCICAKVVLTSGELDIDQLKEFCAEYLPKHMVPCNIELCDRIETSLSGKPVRTAQKKGAV